VKRLLVPSAALLWGLQIAFLSPALALILVTLYDASTAQVGWILTVYNASGFVASLLVPSYILMIPRPGLSTGLYANTRRVGAIVSGPIIALGSTTALGNRGISSSPAASSSSSR
jgi:MFS transporter, SET family, sugar efflux transporter